MRAVLVLLVVGGLPSLVRAAPSTTGPSDDQRREMIDRWLFDPIERSMPGAKDLPERAAMRASRARLALEHLRVLLAKAPNDPELHWLAGTAWMAIGEEDGADKTSAKVIAEAVTELELSRRLAPDGPRAELTASSLGILFSKLGQYERALAEYDRVIHLTTATGLSSDEDIGAANQYSNSAETLMALGRLDEAIARYRRAADLSVNDARSRTLAFFGLGVALDRDEQSEKAREAIHQALVMDRQQPMAVLDDADVFFMPVGDKFYYMALGFLGRDNPAAAATAFRNFLAAQPASRYAGRARAHLAQIAADQSAAAAAGAGHSATALKLHVSVLMGSLDRDARKQAQADEGRLRHCFEIAPVRLGAVSFVELDLYDDESSPFMNVSISHDALGGSPANRLPTTVGDCLSTVARGWRSLLDSGRRASVLLRIEAK